MSMEDFLHEANARRATIADIKAASLLKHEPAPRIATTIRPRNDGRMWGILKDMYEGGPPSGVFTSNQGRGRGRHGWLFHFAGIASGDGHPLDTTVSWLIDVDNAHTLKFSGRPDQETQLRRLAIKAYESTRSSR